MSNELELDTSRLAFVSSLRKFTLLGSSKEMKAKNLAAVKVLLTVAHQDGNRLKESWIDVLQCMSEVERLHLVGAARPDGDVFRSAANNGAGGGAGSASGGRLRESDSANSLAVHHIDSAAIDRVFTSSARLDERAIIDFVMALRQISEVELSNAQQPRVFALQKIVEITSYNMGRIRLVWNRIWAIISEYFIRAGCHPNLQVSIFAIDSVRQLAMKFLEKSPAAALPSNALRLHHTLPARHDPHHHLRLCVDAQGRAGQLSVSEGLLQRSARHAERCPSAATAARWLTPVPPSPPLRVCVLAVHPRTAARSSSRSARWVLSPDPSLHLCVAVRALCDLALRSRSNPSCSTTHHPTRASSSCNVCSV